LVLSPEAIFTKLLTINILDGGPYCKSEKSNGEDGQYSFSNRPYDISPLLSDKWHNENAPNMKRIFNE
jgi:hypothetical protein